jgi:predicted  nucleic acid-binding Zn-ribbon protein
MIEQLLAYQEADKKLKDLEKALAESPERKKAVNAKKYLDGASESVSKLETKAQELNSAFEKAVCDQEKLKEQESELTTTLEQVEDEKGAEYLIKKADELYSKIKELEGRIGKISTEIQALLKEYENVKATTKKAQAQYNENAPKYKALKESMQEEVTSIKAELNAIGSKVDAELMQKYLAKRADRMYPIVFATRGDHCGKCNMELPTSVLGKLKKGEVIECDQCGAILYQK